MQCSQTADARFHTHKTYVRLADFVAQQAAWWSTVLLVLAGWEHTAALPTFAVVLGHLVLTQDGRWTRAYVAIGAMLVGFTFDTTLVALGAISFEADTVVQPIWMTGLWAAFGVAFFTSFAFVRRLSVPLRLVVGAAAGLFAYHAGSSVGVLSVGADLPSKAALATTWAIAVAVLAEVTDLTLGTSKR